ncbi:YciI family protein [soil metagenome]
MKEFMYIFRGAVQNEEAFAKLTPKQMEAEMQKWNVWMGSLAEQGKLVGGQPLFPQGKVIKGKSNKVTDGPFVEGKDIVGGYLLVKANDLQEAVSLSKGCPQLDDAEGTVEVREIMPMEQG